MSHEALALHGGTAAAGTGSTQRTDSTSAASPFGAASALSSNAFLSYTSGMMSSAASATTGGFMGSAGGRTSQDDAQTGNSSYTGLKFGESVPQDKKTMLLFVVGGLSYLEIAACRFLSNDPAFPYRIMLGTTKLINGSTFVNSLKHDFN